MARAWLIASRLPGDGDKTFDLANKRGRCACGRKPKDRNTKFLLRATGRGERGGYDLLKGLMISWLNARFFETGLL
jgi:hypothetical protein